MNLYWIFLEGAKDARNGIDNRELYTPPPLPKGGQGVEDGLFQ
jgi:hypothetical protein